MSANTCKARWINWRSLLLDGQQPGPCQNGSQVGRHVLQSVTDGGGLGDDDDIDAGDYVARLLAQGCSQDTLEAVADRLTAGFATGAHPDPDHAPGRREGEKDGQSARYLDPIRDHTLEVSRMPQRLEARQRAACAPEAGAAAGRCARLDWTSASGNRAPSAFCGAWADRSSSTGIPHALRGRRSIAVARHQMIHPKANRVHRRHPPDLRAGPSGCWTGWHGGNPCIA